MLIPRSTSRLESHLVVVDINKIRIYYCVDGNKINKVEKDKSVERRNWKMTKPKNLEKPNDDFSSQS